MQTSDGMDFFLGGIFIYAELGGCSLFDLVTLMQAIAEFPFIYGIIGSYGLFSGNKKDWIISPV